VQIPWPLSLLSFDYLLIRILCLLACLSSCGALILKVYGVLPMQKTILYGYSISVLLLFLVWHSSRTRTYRAVGESIALGAVAGFVATLTYDPARVPFLLAGQRVFMTNDTYGVWIAEADISSRFTDTLGWTYHFSNGITFGIIYALFLRGQHWAWAVLYALMLETVNLMTPFKEIFGLSNNWLAILILYLGHIAFGIPLGFITRDWGAWLGRMRNLPAWGKVAGLALGPAVAIPILISPERTAFDNRAEVGVLRIEGELLNPEIIRTRRGLDPQLYNPGPAPVMVANKTVGGNFQVPAGARVLATMPHSGVFQLFVETSARSISSFVIVEPVEETPR